MPFENRAPLQTVLTPSMPLDSRRPQLMEDGHTISYRYWPDSGKNNETLVQREISMNF